MGYWKAVRTDTRDISKRSRVERLQTREALWGSLAEEETDIQPPDWHRGLLAERNGKIESGRTPATLRTKSMNGSS
jgi:hypothetical protein